MAPWGIKDIAITWILLFHIPVSLLTLWTNYFPSLHPYNWMLTGTFHIYSPTLPLTPPPKAPLCAFPWGTSNTDPTSACSWPETLACWCPCHSGCAWLGWVLLWWLATWLWLPGCQFSQEILPFHLPYRSLVFSRSLSDITLKNVTLLFRPYIE